MSRVFVFWRAVALAVVVAIVAAACGEAGPEATATSEASPSPTAAAATPPPAPTADLAENARLARRGGVLVLANRGDPPAAFDPMRTSSIALHHPGGGLFGPGNLVFRCRENIYLVCPGLANDWTVSPDFTEWTFTLRRDAAWHDGEPFTADDVAFWFELAAFGIDDERGVRAPAYFRGDLGLASGEAAAVEVLPFRQVRVRLAEPNPHYLEVLMNPRLKVAHPEHLLRPLIDGGDLSAGPVDVGLVGTGPFRLDGYEPGSVLRLRRFDGYWERDAQGEALPYLDGVDFVITPDAAAMDAAFRTGRLDGGARGEGHYLTVERQRGYERDLASDVWYGHMQGGLFRLAFNVLKEGPWQDVGVRQAISLWIDREAAIPGVLGGFGYVSPILGLTNPFTGSDFVTWPRFNSGALEERRAEAKRMLAEAGFADGFSMDYLCRARLVTRCEFLQGQLAGLGVDLELRVVDEAEWNRGRVSLEYDSQPGAHFTTPVPEGTESVFGRYEENPDAYAKHDDRLVDDFYGRLRAARDFNQRVRVWREFEQYFIREQAYVVPIAGSVQVVPYRTYARGVIIPPEDGHTHTNFATVWLDR